MTKINNNYEKVHPATKMYAKEFQKGQLSRREFLSRTTALGLTASAAYALGGLCVRGANAACSGGWSFAAGRNNAHADGCYWVKRSAYF